MADRFVTRLSTELASWVQDGIITEEQRARIAARHDEAGARSRAVIIAILSLVGGALVTAGIALVIAHNWDRLSDWTKIGGLLVLLACFYTCGFELRERGHGGSGEALLMVGGALFLCGIALVGQIYHLNSRPPNAVLIWIVGIFPIAYLVRSAPLLFLALAGMLTWLGMEAYRPDSVIYLGQPDGGRWQMELPVWVGLQSLAVAVGVGLAAAGALHRRKLAGFRGIFEALGLLTLGAGLYMLGFLRHESRSYVEGTWLSRLVLGPILFFAVIAAALAIGSWKRLPAEPARTRPIHFTLMMVCLALALAPSALGRLGSNGAETALNLTLVYWIFLLLFSLHLISAGVRWGRPGWISLGILLVGVNIITRYFDVLGSRLDQGLLYIMGGVLILAISLILERQRRRLLQGIAHQEAS